LPAGTSRRPRHPNNAGDERPHSFSHRRSITADLEASLSGGRHKTALRVASCRLECWQRGLLFLHTWSCCISAGRHLSSSLCRPRAGSLGGGGCKTALRVVRCRLERRRSDPIYSTRSCCESAGGHSFSGCARRPAERRFRGQTYLYWQTSPCFSSSFSSASRMW
jgi:hypothetical protein